MGVTDEERGLVAARHGSAAATPVGTPTRDLSTDAADAGLTAPLTRDLGWATVQAMSQSVQHRDNPVLHGIRASAVVRRGTRMMKVLSADQFVGHLGGWLPYGFCYRVHDVAQLRTPDELNVLRADASGDADAEVAFALRWRAVDPVDYDIPMGTVQSGLTGLPAHSRVGPMVLGTGFTPSADDLIPEFVTADLADLPMPANAQLVAYTPNGDEVVLYAYQPEQHGWIRLVGPRWRHLLTGLPGVSPDREYLPCAEERSSRLVGRFGDKEYEAVADPPHEFRVRALTRAARYPVTSLSRRAEQAVWRDVLCWVLQRDQSWARLRACRPDADAVNAIGARCYERGVYEVWAPVNDLTDHQAVDTRYAL